jgi:FkbM family methyltransferase
MRIFLGLAGSGPFVIHLRPSGLRFTVRGPDDVWTIKETFLDRFYQKFGFAIQPGWQIIDIGGGLGDFTVLAATAAPDTHVSAYEPTADSFALLQANLAANGIEGVQVYPEAIWSQAGELALSASPVEAGRNRSGRPEELPSPVTVRSVTLAEALARLGPRGCQLLKVDCEGAEYAIFLETPPSVLQAVERIVMEYHDGVTEFDHLALVDHLRVCGYTVSTHPNYVHRHLGYLRAWRDRA